MRLRTLLNPLLLAALAVLPTVAYADADANAFASVNAKAEAEAADPAKDPAVARLLDAKGTLRWNYSGRDGRYGHAETLVNAPVADVAKVADDFGRYRQFHRKFATARVIAKSEQTTDVYMRYPVKIGPVKVEFWEVMRFDAPRWIGETHVLEGQGIQGDMKRGRTIVTVKPVGPKHSLVQVDVMLVPKVPAPQVLIDEELRDGAFDFVNGIRSLSQGWVGPVTSL
jgi:hypothetical protein